MAIWNLDVYDYIPFIDGNRSNPIGLSITDKLELLDSNQSNQHQPVIQQYISLVQTISYNYGIVQKSISDEIHFRDRPERGKYESVQHYINFNERFIKPHDLHVTQSITLTQHLNYPGRIHTDFLNLQKTIVLHKVKKLDVIQTLTLINSPEVIKEYYNFLGIPPTSITPNSQVTFSCSNPSTGLTKRITIKSPDFEDTDELHFQKVQRNTRNGDLIIYRDPIWPVYEVFNLHFSYLRDSDINQLLDFLQFSLGLDVTYIDFEGQNWIGVSTTPIGEIVTPGRFNNKANLVFEVN